VSKKAIIIRALTIMFNPRQGEDVPELSAIWLPSDAGAAANVLDIIAEAKV
jgi:hypothetical protein